MARRLRRHSPSPVSVRLMLVTFQDPQNASALGEGSADSLERGEIVYFPRSPVPFPSEEDLHFLRKEMPSFLGRKNPSYHPEIDRVAGLSGPKGVRERAHRILRDHGREVRAYLERAIPSLARGWRVGTSSFRPVEERGRTLGVRASNEFVHFDAGAYGATHGDRVLRFFMNANPREDRVWVSKGTYRDLYPRLAAMAGILPPKGRGHDLGPRVFDRLRTGLARGLSRVGLGAARFLETSPYDRLMRRLHNAMKECATFQAAGPGDCEIRFRPGSAWMVFTDQVSHACRSGKFAFIDTFIVPLGNCRRPEFVPFHILEEFRVGFLGG